MIQDIMDKIYFTDEELAGIDLQAKSELGGISEARDKKLVDLQTKERNYLADVGYLAENKVSLMRSGGWTPEMLFVEGNRLDGLLNGIRDEIKIYAESAQEILKYVISFSELVKNSGIYFKYALDSEKRDIATQIFYEITVKDKTIESYKAKDGFDVLLARIRLTGGLTKPGMEHFRKDN